MYFLGGSFFAIWLSKLIVLVGAWNADGRDLMPDLREFLISATFESLNPK
jgi:hypothetical protein